MDIEAFYDEYADKVYKFFYIKSLDKSTAEDLTSQTFVAFLEKVNAIEIEKYKEYLYGIMRTVWITFLKNKYKESIKYLEDVEQFDVYSERVIEDDESKSNIKERLQIFIEKLPDKQKTVLRMRIIEDMSVKAVAEELGKDKNYVKTTHQRALKRLREIMEQPYLETSHE